MALREIDIQTGLYTPGFFVAFGARELSFARESGYPVSLVSIRVEEPHEHRVIGEVPVAEPLRSLGERVRKAAGEASIVARVGEDELAVLLPGVSLERARKIAEAIGAELLSGSKATNAAGGAVSVGVASSADGRADFSELLRESLDALETARP